ncbi:MAG: DUF3592 domain-containing protein [Deltaproteobacteria bacterium]|nr:DUF3592 domain-containing protein [Deltaproteobacteria bacterium]MBW2537613.1 DUF3592 domain-containing protein [Deltaproteobacteria bacterium]
MSNDDLITMVVFSGLEIVCLLIMLVAGVKILITFARSLRLRRAEGVVVAHQLHHTTMRGASGYGSRQVTLHKPVVRFTAPDGRVIDLLHPIASSRPPAIGSPVPVAFDPRNPSRAEVASGLARYLGAGVTLVAVGIVLAILVGVQLSVLR